MASTYQPEFEQRANPEQMFGSLVPPTPPSGSLPALSFSRFPPHFPIHLPTSASEILPATSPIDALAFLSIIHRSGKSLAIAQPVPSCQYNPTRSSHMSPRRSPVHSPSHPSSRPASHVRLLLSPLPSLRSPPVLAFGARSLPPLLSVFHSNRLAHHQANLPGYPTIIDGYVDPHIPAALSSTTFTLSDLYSQQSALLDSPFQHTSAYSQLSGSDYTPSPPNTGYLAAQTLEHARPRQSSGRNLWGVPPHPDLMSCTLETGPIPSIRKASLPPSLLAARASAAATSSPATEAPLSARSEPTFNTTALRTSSLGQDGGYQSSSSTPTPSPTPSPTSPTFSSSQVSVKSEASSDSGNRTFSSQLKHTDFRRRRADRRRSKLLEIASVLPFRATDP